MVRSFLFLVGALALLVCGPVAAQTALSQTAAAQTISPLIQSVPKSRVLEYAVMRNGDSIGEFVFRFRPDGERLAVDVDSKIEYRLFFIRLYYHFHRSREVWRGDRLISMKSKTDDNGEEKILEVTENDDGLDVIGPKGERKVAAGMPPASFWHAAALKSPQMIGTISGGIENIEAAFIGDETIQVKGQPVKTKLYKMTGDIKRELWFDPADNMALVHLRFEAKDGSTVEYVLK